MQETKRSSRGPNFFATKNPWVLIRRFGQEVAEQAMKDVEKAAVFLGLLSRWMLL